MSGGTVKLSHSPETVSLTVRQTDAPLSRRPPSGMDRYKPLNVLGSGGNAEVVLCRDQILGREIAVKRLKEDCPIDSPTERRFLREARIMAALPHPAIPIVYDLGRDHEGRPFFVTDVLKDGIYLVNVLSGLRRGVMEIEHEYPLERLIRIMMLVCGAIEDAHKRGVIHRDIKPEHIFITGRNRVILLDWGLARLANEKWEPKGPEADHVSNNSDLQANRLTVQGQLPGTPLYMSPEQVSDSPDLDHRTDIYSIGAVLYDCLVLDTLVSGRTVGEVFDCIMKGEVAKPTDVSKRRDLTAELERVCLKAVAKDPRDRYETAAQLGEALRECQLTLLANFERDLDRSVPRFNFGAPAGSNSTHKPPSSAAKNDSRTASETNQRRRSLEAGICQEMLVGNRPNIDLSEAIVPFGRKPKPGRKKRPGNSR